MQALTDTAECPLIFAGGNATPDRRNAGVNIAQGRTEVWCCKTV